MSSNPIIALGEGRLQKKKKKLTSWIKKLLVSFDDDKASDSGDDELSEDSADDELSEDSANDELTEDFADDEPRK